MGQEGSERLWTPANIVTLVRVGCVFLWVLAAQLAGAPVAGVPVSWPHLWCGVFFGLIAGTDSLDGHLARSRNEVTTFGKFLDPIADKLVVVCALLVLMDWGLVSLWVIAIIVAREFLVSGLRMVVAGKGTVVAASMLGKWKTATTMGAIGGYLACTAFPMGWFGALLFWASSVAMAVAVILTVWSGWDYLKSCWPDVRG